METKDHHGDNSVAVRLKGLTKSFRSGMAGSSAVPVLSNVTINIAPREIVSILGPNGCGKTTLLNILAGLTPADEGHVSRTGDAAGLIGYVFQNYADSVLPWATVRSNVAFPLRVQGMSEEMISTRVAEYLQRFRLLEHAEKFPYELSGGLRQLLAIARSAVYQPGLLILDEPFSALDFFNSRDLWVSVRANCRKEVATTILVSHNLDEAVFIGDRVIILSRRPARIIADIPINLPPDRTIDLLLSADFSARRNDVLRAFDLALQS